MSTRQWEIVKLLGQRMSNKEIGAAPRIKTRTVDAQLRFIFVKLGVTSRGAVVDVVRSWNGVGLA